VTNYEAESLKAGLNHLRFTMANEHAAVWQAGVHALVVEMMLSAAGQAIQRSNLAREQLWEILHPSLPPPMEQPSVALQGDSRAYLNNDPDLADIYSDNGNDPFDVPRYLKGATR
jgi:hypothetical protein